MQPEQDIDAVRFTLKRITAQRDRAAYALRSIQRSLATGRQVCRDKEAAYQDAEWIADIALKELARTEK